MRWDLDVVQVLVRVMVTARWPAWSEFSQNCARPLEMLAPPAVQPDGSSAMHGSTAAEGTAWADKIMERPVPQDGGVDPRFDGGRNAELVTARASAAAPSTVAVTSTRLAPQRCKVMGRRGGASLRNSPSRSRGSRRMKARS